MLIRTGITTFLQNMLNVSTPILSDERSGHKRPFLHLSKPFCLMETIPWHHTLMKESCSKIIGKNIEKWGNTGQNGGACLFWTTSSGGWKHAASGEVLTMSTFRKNAVIPVMINILILYFDKISDKDCFNMLQSFRAYLYYLRVLYWKVWGLFVLDHLVHST